MTRCKQCGKVLSPVEAMLGPVCGECVRRNHREATAPGRERRKDNESKGCRSGRTRGGD